MCACFFCKHDTRSGKTKINKKCLEIDNKKNLNTKRDVYSVQLNKKIARKIEPTSTEKKHMKIKFNEIILWQVYYLNKFMQKERDFV